jgi:hypothetical protein
VAALASGRQRSNRIAIAWMARPPLSIARYILEDKQKWRIGKIYFLCLISNHDKDKIMIF